MKRLPIGIETFKKIILDNYVYIDKTQIACNLIDSGEYYFLSRPRRFGKSLFVDTLQEIFEGNKDLFKGLYIYNNYDWSKSYPVIKISLGGGIVDSRQSLDKKIINILKDNQKLLKVECEDISDVARCFETLITSAYKKYKERVVILVDEYDKPILDNITNTKIAEEVRDGLKNFYSVIKDNDRFIKFAFLTGVSKFSKVSLFSGLNNLEDITLNPRYSTICGYTQEDVESYFTEYLKEVDLEKLKIWYNGYSWLGESVYNPFDILLFLNNQDRTFKNYWFETATPNFLVNLLKEQNFFLPNLENLEVNESDLGSFDIDYIKAETLLFQTGYLTIKKVETIFDSIAYTLSYPNKEVKKSLNEFLFNFFSGIQDQKRLPLYKSLKENNFPALKKHITSLFASIPYNNFTKNKMYEKEGYYSSLIYAYFASLGLDLIPEDTTNKGRIDLTMKFPNESKVYIFEFKVIEDSDISKNPIDQIKDKGYPEKYSELEEIYLIGIEFSKKDKNISTFKWEKL